MIRSNWLSACAVVGLQGMLCVAQPAFAQSSDTKTSTVTPTDVPRTISYQGYLTSAEGKSLHDGQYAVTVRLYSDPEGAQAIYDATYQATVVNGIFNIMLGSGHAPLPMLDKLNSPLWIGITVNGHEELKPYTALSASPYALNVPNNAISSDKLQDGSVTARKIGADYVGSLWIDGEKVSDRGSKISLEGANGIELQYDIARNAIIFSGAGMHLNGATQSSPESGIAAPSAVANGNSSIKFTGKAATNLDMNSNAISNIGELSLGKGKLFNGLLSFYTANSAGHATIVGGPQQLDHTYTIPDAGVSAQFILSEGNQSINGTKTFDQAIIGDLNGNALTASTAQRAETADQVSNSWVSGASIISALMVNGGTLTNNTLGNAKTSNTATMALTAHTAEQANQVANTFSAGASIDRALKAYNKPVAIDITGGSTRALSANEAAHAASADHAAELINTHDAGASAASALKAWGGTLTNNISGNSLSATNAQHSATAERATSATNAEHAANADRAINATNADHATVAGTVTNGVYQTGKYADPSWLTSISAAKLVGSVPNAEFAKRAGSAAPTGSASGNLSGSYPNPSVVSVDVTAGASVVEAINHSSGTIAAQSIAKNLTISGGSVNSTPIGMSMPAAAAFTTSQTTTVLGGNVVPQKGTRYADNNIVAWGDVAADGKINSQFGGVTIVRLSSGVYRITLPDMPQASAVQITSQSTTPMAFSAQRVGSTVTVRAFDLTRTSTAADGPFYFLVVTRP